jgi:soluble lytic murein transglycosylase-like protein
MRRSWSLLPIILAGICPGPVHSGVPGGSSVPFSGPHERCIVPAASYHGVNHDVLRAILRVESGLQPNAVARNRNGSIDVGIGQINSIHFRELAKFGISPTHLKDACIGIYVAAWQLKKGMTARGNSWEGIASYHSSTPYFNRRYQILLNNELVKANAISGAILPVPPLKRRLE